MTAPQQQPGPVPPVDPQQTPQQAPAPTPVSEGQSPWPPDDQTLMQLQMDARFSIIEEPAGEETQGADRQEQTPAGPPQPQQRAPLQTQG